MKGQAKAIRAPTDIPSAWVGGTMANPPPRRSKAWLSCPCLCRGDVTWERRCLDLLKQMETSGGHLPQTGSQF